MGGVFALETIGGSPMLDPQTEKWPEALARTLSLKMAHARDL